MRDLILFTPGPVRIPAKVAESLANPPCNYHRQDAFRDMLRKGGFYAEMKQFFGEDEWGLLEKVTGKLA